MVLFDKISDNYSHTTAGPNVAMYEDIGRFSCLFNEVKGLIEVFLNVKIFAIFNLKVEIFLNFCLRVVNFSSFGCGDDSFDVEFWDGEIFTLQNGKIRGSFGIGDVQGANRTEPFKDTAQIEVHDLGQ